VHVRERSVVPAELDVDVFRFSRCPDGSPLLGQALSEIGLARHNTYQERVVRDSSEWFLEMVIIHIK
jgi:hypothetical protein